MNGDLGGMCRMRRRSFLMLGMVIVGSIVMCAGEESVNASDAGYITEESIELIQTGDIVVPDEVYSFSENDSIYEEDIHIYNNGEDDEAGGSVDGNTDSAEQLAAQQARADDNASLSERQAECAIAVYNAMSIMQPTINVSEYALTRNELQQVISNVVNSNPELFYIRNGYGVRTFYLSSTDKTEIVRECLGFYEGQTTLRNSAGKITGYTDVDTDGIQSKIKELSEKRDEILSETIKEDMTDAEKALLIHDYLVLNIQYDYENYLKNKQDKTYVLPDSDYDIYGALIEGKAVCQGYSLAYKYLMEFAGFEKIGFASTDSHIWNTVTINDEGYYVDCTWDDPSWDTLGNVKHTYLLQGKADFSGHGSNYESDRECNGTEFSNMFWKRVNTGIFYIKGKYYYIDSLGDLCAKNSIYSDFTQVIKSLSIEKNDNWNYTNAAKLAVSDNYAVYHDEKNLYACTYTGDKSGVLYTPDTTQEEMIFGITAKNDVLSYGIKNVSDMETNGGVAEQTIYTYQLPEDPFNVAVKSVSISGKDTLYIRIVDGKEVYEQANLTARIYPEDATNQIIRTWTSSNPSVVMVDINGKIKGLSVGEAVIKAVSADGPYAEYTVKVVYDGDVTASDGEVLHYDKGTLLTSRFYTENGNIYYLGTDGKKVRGFYAVNGNTYYFDSNGIMLTGWQTISGNVYYFDSDGIMQTGWMDNSSGTYYFAGNGVMLTGWQTIDGVKYYFDTDGILLTVGWTKISGNTYYFNMKGVPVTGWQNISGSQYYFDSNGVMQTGWKDISGGRYYFDDNGVMQTGWKNISGNKYYFNDNGVMQTGWKKIGKKKYYFNKTGVMQTGWKKIGKKKYYFSKKGVMQTGWKKIGKKKYYFNKKGVMQTGWKKIGKKKYYFSKKGVMQTGWKTINNKKYYFKKNGVMVTGLQIIKGISYYFASDGHFVS